MLACAFCGRDNDGGSRFCIDCGKPISPSAARVVPGAFLPAQGKSASAPASAGKGAAVPAALAVPATRISAGAGETTCAHCTRVIDASLPFCSYCGHRTPAHGVPNVACASCGALMQPGIDLYCPRCGTRAPEESARNTATAAMDAVQREAGPRLSLLDDEGLPTRSFPLGAGEAVVGRSDGDIRFADDVYLSPVHAQFSMRAGGLCVRDLGSRNGTWVFLDGPCRLSDGDVILVGSQLLRFRRLGYPGPHPPEADATRRLGSLTPSADIAVLAQLRSDGSVRDTLHLSPGRSVIIGREQGDWLFPYDQTMSGRHAEIRSEDSEFVAHDAGSRNGVAIAVRGERTIKEGTRVLMGDQILRVERL